MEQEDKFWLGLWIVIGFVVISFGLGSQYFYNQRCKMFIESGYEMGTVQGSNTGCWLKVKE